MFVARVFSVFCVVLLAVQSGEKHVRNFAIIHIYIYIYIYIYIICLIFKKHIFL